VTAYLSVLLWPAEIVLGDAVKLVISGTTVAASLPAHASER
jgi:hypothetical protein